MSAIKESSEMILTLSPQLLLNYDMLISIHLVPFTSRQTGCPLLFPLIVPRLLSYRKKGGGEDNQQTARRKVNVTSFRNREYHLFCF